ncbi:MAG: hypothetical protein AABX98_05445 [Nanoarchaeota archaeon]
MPLPKLDDVIKYADVRYELPAAVQRPRRETYALGLGVGYRTFNPNEGVEEYMRGISGDDVVVASPLEGDITFPYITLTLRLPKIADPRFNNKLAVGLSVDWMSSFLIEDQSGSEDLAVEYSGADLGDAKARWEYYFGTYLSGGVSAIYAPIVIRNHFFAIIPQLVATVGLSYIQNKIEVDMDMRHFKLVESVGEEILENEYGFYAESKTIAEMQGIGAYLAPSIGIRLVHGYFAAVFTIEYRQEEIPLHIEEKTIYGDNEVVSTRSTEIMMDTSGPTGTASLEYRF